ncbi:uncharacterized protein LOC120082554 isoform X2 [Benincasa hispida]|uniref:uncharacterized protein LOC120082554 isoform X2 n=1 Tax=Benincasa hispida TaxID=102211 RepID=UPI001901FD84|nr:uncharacterized protein LOC120082554 isoform X2 [Benincasa hispida]
MGILQRSSILFPMALFKGRILVKKPIGVRVYLSSLNPSLTSVPMNPFARPNKSHGSHIIGGILGRKWRRLLFLWQRRSVPGTNSPIPDHDNECDKTDACVENIESNNREDNDSKDVIEAENDDCETLVPAKNVVQPGKEMSPAPAENIVESGKMTEHGTFEQEGECSMKPKESKDRNVSLDLSIALRKGTRSCTKYPLQSYLSYSNLSPEFKALTTNLDTVVIPNSIHTALESRSHGRNCGSREKSYVRPGHSETLVPAKNVVQPGKEMSPAPTENIVESGKMTEHGTFEQEGECSMKPKESKDRNVSLDLLIALRKGTRSCTKYPLQSYLSYSNLSPFKALTTNLNTVVIPNSIHTALESRSHGRNCGSREKSYVRPSHSSKWS